MVKWDLISLFLFALVVRGLTAWPQQQPHYMDAAYYYVNGINLATGRGFVEDFLWNYLGYPARPPQPSHLYWMPLTSILAAMSMAIFGVTYRGAQIPFIIISALLAPLTYHLAQTLNQRRGFCWVAGLLAIFSGFYVPYWTAIDNFTPFAITGALALWQASGEKRWQLVGSGICIGLAHLARADGALLAVAVILVYFFRSFVGVSKFYFDRQKWTPLFLILLGYGLTMTPWLIRNWQATGSPLTVAGSQTIWLTHYDDLFSYRRELSARTFMAQGAWAILQGRWWALTINLQRVLAEWFMIFLLPLVLVGVWQGRRHLFVQISSLYALLLFVAMTVVFAFPGARGGLFHSGAALLPFIYSTAMVGLDTAIQWAAARRKWHVPLAKLTFSVGIVNLAVVLSGYIYYQSVMRHDAWNSSDKDYPAIAAWVKATNPDALVMIGNPPAYRYHGGGLSVIVPNENLTTTLQVMQQYQVTYLVLDNNCPAPLAEVYRQIITSPALSLREIFGTANKIYLFEVK